MTDPAIGALHIPAKAVVQEADQKVLKSFDRASENHFTAPTVLTLGRLTRQSRRTLSPQE
jgi:hypothetical protein